MIQPDDGTGIQMPSPDDIRMMHRRVSRWYALYARKLPWRDSDDVYTVFVSEYMLQQTQVTRVMEKLPQWMQLFPDLETLARAGKRKVLLAWSGMGYNRRALALHEAAKRIVHDFNGRIPDQVELLRSLPGIGAYTANAIVCFGHKKRAAMVDINIRRVLSRLLSKQIRECDMLPEALVWTIAGYLLPVRAYYNWNQALMDLGAQHCTARLPSCSQCPLVDYCISQGTMVAAEKAAVSVVREPPRRIFRGRIVEELRRTPGHQLSTAQLLHRVYNDHEDGIKLLSDALASLEKDGLVSLHPDDNGTLPLSVLVRLAE